MSDGIDRLRDSVKPDDIAATLKEALGLCLEAARRPASALRAIPEDDTGATVDAA
jgi:hypothetical protein